MRRPFLICPRSFFCSGVGRGTKEPQLQYGKQYRQYGCARGDKEGEEKKSTERGVSYDLLTPAHVRAHTHTCASSLTSFRAECAETFDKANEDIVHR